MNKYLTILLLLASPMAAFSQVANFSLPNVTEGKNVSLSDYSSYGSVVIIFTSNACPYDAYYYSRIKKLAHDYAGKVPVILVNAHAADNESPESMKKTAQQLSFDMPYLADKDQVLMQQLSATKSPEAFLLKGNGGKFSVFYRGAIDDNAQVDADVHQSYLRSAMDALLAGKPSPDASEVRPVGCIIKRKS